MLRGEIKKRHQNSTPNISQLSSVAILIPVLEGLEWPFMCIKINQKCNILSFELEKLSQNIKASTPISYLGLEQ